MKSDERPTPLLSATTLIGPATVFVVVGLLLPLAILLRYSFNQTAAAEAIEKAVSLVLDQGLRTGDIFSQGCRKVGTQEMGDAVVAALRNL